MSTWLVTLLLAATLHFPGDIFITDDATLKLAWDALPVEQGVTFYQLELRTMYGFARTFRHTTTATEITVPQPATGFLKAYVRGCRTETECGPWAACDDSQAVVKVGETLVLRPWLLYWRVQPIIPGGQP